MGLFHVKFKTCFMLLGWRFHCLGAYFFGDWNQKLFNYGALWRRGRKKREKSWLVDMTLIMTSLPLAPVFQCLFTFVLVSASSGDGEPQGNWRWNSNARDEVAISRAPRRACSQAHKEWERRFPGSDDKIRVLLIWVECNTFRLPVQKLYH